MYLYVPLVVTNTVKTLGITDFFTVWRGLLRYIHFYKNKKPPIKKTVFIRCTFYIAPNGECIKVQ